MDIELGEVEIDIAKPTISLLELPKKWALQKPLADYNTDLVDKLIRENRIVGTKKYNGHRVHILVNQNSQVLLYNRTNKDIINPFVPALVSQLESSNIPPNTLIDGEIFVPAAGKESLDQLQYVISCGNPILGAEREKEIAPQIAAFDCLISNGDNLILQPYQTRAQAIPSHGIIQAEQVSIQSREQGLALAESNQWEGLVLWDIKSPHRLNTNGNTKRGGCYKLKREFDEDFVAVGFKEGTGHGKGMVGTLLIGKYQNGTLIPFGEVGSGLSLEQKKLYTDKTRYPFVVAVRHFGLDEKGRVTLPTISKIHLDKLPSEV